MVDNVEVQQDLAADLMEVINKYKKSENLTYATVLGVLDIIGDMLKEELRELEDEQDFSSHPLFKTLTQNSHAENNGDGEGFGENIT